MATKESKDKSTKTTYLLPDQYLEALEIIRKEERMLKSHQVELALKAYFERYRPLLVAKGVDLWQ